MTTAAWIIGGIIAALALVVVAEDAIDRRARRRAARHPRPLADGCPHCGAEIMCECAAACPACSGDADA